MRRRPPPPPLLLLLRNHGSFPDFSSSCSDEADRRAVRSVACARAPARAAVEITNFVDLLLKNRPRAIQSKQAVVPITSLTVVQATQRAASVQTSTVRSTSRRTTESSPAPVQFSADFQTTSTMERNSFSAVEARGWYRKKKKKKKRKKKKKPDRTGIKTKEPFLVSGVSRRV